MCLKIIELGVSIKFIKIGGFSFIVKVAYLTNKKQIKI